MFNISKKQILVIACRDRKEILAQCVLDLQDCMDQ